MSWASKLLKYLPQELSAFHARHAAHAAAARFPMLCLYTCTHTPSGANIFHGHPKTIAKAKSCQGRGLNYAHLQIHLTDTPLCCRPRRCLLLAAGLERSVACIPNKFITGMFTLSAQDTAQQRHPGRGRSMRGLRIFGILLVYLFALRLGEIHRSRRRRKHYFRH